ncbi:hypothetical protein ACVWW5_006602 [Bradyrhizobium sp. LM3.4]
MTFSSTARVVAEKVDRKIVVGRDTADLCRCVNHDFGTIGLEPSQRGLFLCEIQFAAVSNDDGAILRRKPADDS